MHPFIKKYQKIIEYEFKDTFKYADKLADVRSYQISYDGFKKMVQEKNNAINEWELPWLFEIGMYHYEYSFYAKLHLGNETLWKEHLTLAVNYASVALTTTAQSCGCYEERNPFIIMNKATFMMSMVLLTSSEKEFDTIGNYLIDSLNGDGCIIKRGYGKATVSWFVLKLYSLYANKEITLNPLLQPKDTYGYSKILDNWDTTDIKEITLYIELLCEVHIVQAQKDDDIYLKIKDDPEDLTYRELFLVSSYFLPYEVLTWLKLREKAGLKNPKTFSHPLMNTAIAKMFLSLKEPLPKPTELPYAKELLEKLQEKCPDVEIPEWLNTETKEEVTPVQDNNTIPDDFMK
jgi:hypothetical protein